MARYILARLATGLLTTVGVLLVVFILTRVAGSPVDVILPQDASAAERARLTHELGFDKPYPVQLYEFFSAAVRGDFGDSWYQNRSALVVAAERWPRTLVLTALAFSLAMLLAIPGGVTAAWKKGTVVDRTLSGVMLAGACVPNFWTGLMLMSLFAVQLRWFPAEGSGGFKYLVLPALALSARPLGRIGQVIRSAMLDELGKQYVLTAVAKGLGERLVLIRHALRNAMIPVLSMSGWELALMLGGHTVAIESVFNYPGIGHLVISAISYHDYPVLQAITLIIALTIVVVNLLTDLAYVIFDPNILV